MAADILAENADLKFNTISQDEIEFVDALILTASSPEESFRKFQLLANKHIDTQRRITKSIQDSRLNRDNEKFNDCLEKIYTCFDQVFGTLQQKINPDTWFYAKRCFLALIEVLAKYMIIFKDTSYSEILDFLDAADSFGKAILSVINPLEQMNEKHTVSYEARMIQRIFKKLRM